MSDEQTVDCTYPHTYDEAISRAVEVINSGELIVLPTDTVYGIGADAFNEESVAKLLAAKGRGRHMPPPVLVGNLNVLDALAVNISEETRALAEAFWPGALTIICQAQPSLAWDLGETHGTVALRMPDHDFTLQLLQKTGPMAVSSANRTGYPAATSAAEAKAQLADRVALYLDAGNSTGSIASTIIDTTTSVITVVRPGAILTSQLSAVANVAGPPDPVG